MLLPKVSRKLSRGWVLLIAAFMLSGVLFLSIPLAQAQSNGFFDGPHTDSGVDADGNGRYEYLLLDVRVNVTAAGDFTVIGMLWDSTETTFITSASTAFTSGVGLYVATLPFNGTHIFESDIDGPYKATLELWND
ncbi:MAG: hypothetical protein GTO49_06545, partial [Anaerolineae bacterium]|nr:hypothetical protein [Anaerolineae bacterium]